MEAFYFQDFVLGFYAILILHNILQSTTKIDTRYIAKKGAYVQCREPSVVSE